MGAMLLLTDGRVLVHEEPNCSASSTCVGTSYSTWYTLTPDKTGSYINGTWKKVAPLPKAYEPLFFASAVLPDGNVVVQGGEYNCPSGNCSGVWQSLGALYDPTTNKWSATTPPVSGGIGDAESVVLPSGTWMLAACCAEISGFTSFPEYYYFDESTLSFTNEASATDGVFDDFDEQGFTLLPNGKVLTVDAYVGFYSAKGMNFQLYNPTTNTWSKAGSTKVQLWDSGCGNSSGASYELGPAVLMPNGTVFYTGASSCAAGKTATYDWSTGVWTPQSPFPNGDAANDAPASIETNGNVIVMASPYNGVFSSPSNFYEWNGTTLNSFPSPPNAANDPSFVGHLLVLPTGQIMFTDFSTDVEILTTAGTYQYLLATDDYQFPGNAVFPAPRTPSPARSSTDCPRVPLTVTFPGRHQLPLGQTCTQFPRIRVLHQDSRPQHHGSGDRLDLGLHQDFDVPASMPPGACKLYVIANGIPSAPAACSVAKKTD